MSTQPDKTSLRSLFPLAVVFILLTASAFYFPPKSPLIILPLFVSLVVSLLQSHVNRYAPLLGGINSILYAYVYFFYGLHAMAAYALLVSCPLQLITFINWQKRAYRRSIVFRRLSNRHRLIITAACLTFWLTTYAILSAIGSSYLLLDNSVALLGILTTFLMMFSCIEYTVLMIPGALTSIILHARMIVDHPEQTAFLIYSLYSLYCVTMAFFRARALYAEQCRAKLASSCDEPAGEADAGLSGFPRAAHAKRACLVAAGVKAPLAPRGSRRLWRRSRSRAHPGR